MENQKVRSVNKRPLEKCNLKPIKKIKLESDPIDTSLASSSNLDQRSDKLGNHTDSAKNDYLLHGITQQIYDFLSAIASANNVPVSASKTPLFKLCVETVKEFQLNEIEIMAWAVCLDKYVWPMMDRDILPLFQFSALVVKE